MVSNLLEDLLHGFAADSIVAIYPDISTAENFVHGILLPIRFNPKIILSPINARCLRFGMLYGGMAAAGVKTEDLCYIRSDKKEVF
jgi:hypothetical protein